MTLWSLESAASVPFIAACLLGRTASPYLIWIMISLVDGRTLVWAGKAETLVVISAYDKIHRQERSQTMRRILQG